MSSERRYTYAGCIDESSDLDNYTVSDREPMGDFLGMVFSERNEEIGLGLLP